MSRCLAIIAAVLFSFASASVKDAGVNVGGASADEIDRQVEELLKKNLKDVNTFTSEYLISNGLKLTVEEAYAVVEKITDPEKSRDGQFHWHLAKVLDLCEKLNAELGSCPATKEKRVSSLVTKGKVKDIKDDLVAFVDEWKCPKGEHKKKKFASKFFGENGVQWQYFEDMRNMLRKNPRKAMYKVMEVMRDYNLMGKESSQSPMVAMVVEQLVHNPDVAEYGITAIDWAETFFKSESGKRINGMLPNLVEANSEEAMQMFSKEADFNQEAFFALMDKTDVADGFLKNVAHYVVMANTWVREAMADNMKFAMANGFLVSNKMPVIDRRNIIKSACQIIDRGVNLYSPWSGNYNFWPTIKAFMDEFEKVYFKIDHVKKMKEPELENVLRQFMGDNLMEPLKDAYLVNRHVTNVDHHCDEIAICLFNEIYRDRTSINTMMVGGISRALISSWDAMYDGHDTAKLEEAVRVGQETKKPCKSVFITAPEACDVFEVRRKELSKGKMNLSYEHNEL